MEKSWNFVFGDFLACYSWNFFGGYVCNWLFSFHIDPGKFSEDHGKFMEKSWNFIFGNGWKPWHRLFENIIYDVSRVKFWKVGVIPSFFWYGNDKDLKVCFLVTCVITGKRPWTDMNSTVFVSGIWMGFTWWRRTPGNSGGKVKKGSFQWLKSKLDIKNEYGPGLEEVSGKSFDVICLQETWTWDYISKKCLKG